jgi:cytochrome c biogenesis protein CcmG/thiol:disulfide interchange protein DsbE
MAQFRLRAPWGALAGALSLLVSFAVVSAGAPAVTGKPGASLPPAQRSGPKTRSTGSMRAPAKASAEGRGRVTAQAESLLEAVTTTYQNLSSYDIVGNSHMIMSLGGVVQTLDVPFRLAAAKPARLRNEIMNPAMSYVNVSDGSKTWVYLPQSRQYTVKDAAPLTPAGSSAGEIGNAMAIGTPIQRYLTLGQGLLSARVAGEATVDAGGRSVPCTLIEAQYATPDSTRLELSPNTFWIDPKRGLVVRDSLQVKVSQGPNGGPVTMATVTTFQRLDVDQPFPDTMFTFHAPEGAAQVDEFSQPGMTEPKSPLVGKPALDFTLTDVTGRKQRLSALKGKVVLLDFWATWCGPCRREMPTIVKLHKELSPKGLAIVAVNVGEPHETVNAFLKKNMVSIPVWLDLDTQVSSKYGANSIPTLVVIDRTGKVTAYKVGMRDEATLRALLDEAGL